jgi:hypothetical protein
VDNGVEANSLRAGNFSYPADRLSDFLVRMAGLRGGGARFPHTGTGIFLSRAANLPARAGKFVKTPAPCRPASASFSMRIWNMIAAIFALYTGCPRF